MLDRVSFVVVRLGVVPPFSVTVWRMSLLAFAWGVARLEADVGSASVPACYEGCLASGSQPGAVMEARSHRDAPLAGGQRWHADSQPQDVATVGNLVDCCGGHLAALQSYRDCSPTLGVSPCGELCDCQLVPVSRLDRQGLSTASGMAPSGTVWPMTPFPMVDSVTV